MKNRRFISLFVVAIVAFASASYSVAQEKPVEKVSEAEKTVLEAKPRASAHACLNDFMELYRKNDADARESIIQYLDISKLSDEDKANAVILALKLGEYLLDNELATNAKFEELRAKKDQPEHCLQYAESEEDEEHPECLVRLAAQPDGLWKFDGKTVASVMLLAAQKPAKTPAPPAVSDNPAAAGAPAANPQPVLQVAQEYASPQATMNTFLQAFRTADKTKSATCLDLAGHTGVQPSDRHAHLLVDALKFVLDHTVFVKVLELPEDANTKSPYVYRVVDGRDIALERVPDGRWLFSQKTLAELQEMCRAVANVPAKVPYAPDITFRETPELWVFLKLPSQLQGKIGALSIWQWCGLIAVAIITWILQKTVRIILRRISHAIIRRLKGRDVAELEEGALRPIGLVVFGVTWWHLLPYLWLPNPWGNIVTTGAWFIVVTAGIWGTIRLIDLVAGYLDIVAAKTESKFDEMLVPFGRKIAKVVVTIGGLVYLASRIFPENYHTLLGGLGLGGLAFALAAQDTIKNLFGSLTVMLDRPFEVGDWVKIGEYEGTVESVGFRSTRIRTFYHSQINIPNGKLIDAIVDNLGRRQYRRFSTRLGITYDTPPEKIEAFCEGIRELIRRHPFTRKDYYHVYFNGLGNTSLEILLYVFHEVPDWSTELRERHRLLLDIVRLAKQIDVEFAFPTQTLHVRNADDDIPEPIMPPTRVDELNPEMVGRSEAAAITSLTLRPDDDLSPVRTQSSPQPVDEDYVKERTKDAAIRWPKPKKR